jgi:2-polyprenyl-3-methyl-5-hydroxy-6-metoxy-1,4-benzoquinol methylase
MKICEVCNSKKIKKVLDLGQHPLCDDLIKISSKKINKLYPIKIFFCLNCYTAHNYKKIKKTILFPKNYHYRARLTQDVLNGMKQLVLDCKKKFGSLKNKTILDIGCNDGSLLNFFKKEGCVTIGVEPTNAYKDIDLNKHVIYNTYLDQNTVSQIKKNHSNIDIITFTNVFAHINNLKELLNNLKTLLKFNTSVVIENHYLGSVLNKNQFDTFYHEHPRTYSAKSFFFIARQLNLFVNNISFPSRYGGNIRVFLNKSEIKENYNIFQQEKYFFKKFKEMRLNIINWKKNKKELIINLYKKYGIMIGKAFPGRASILIRMLNINEKFIWAIFEKNDSPKIGHYVPGTKIPIYSDNILKKNKNNFKIIINFAWHIKKEIKKYLNKNNINARIINIIEKNDFIK